MANLPEGLYDAVVRQLEPNLDEKSRQEALMPRLSNRLIWREIKWEGSAHDFTIRLVYQLPREDLIALLERLREGEQERQQVECLVQQLRELPELRPQELTGSVAKTSAGAVSQMTPDIAALVQIFKSDFLPLMRQSGSLGTQLKAPRPEFEDLFEIVAELPEVLPALYRATPEICFGSHEMTYVRERTDNADVQSELSAALLDAGGRLVVQGRAGLGKTREAAELAKSLCTKGWRICVPKAESDRLLNPPNGLPARLYDEKLLLVFDDVHRRLQLPDIEGHTPYETRLAAFLAYFDAQIKRGTVYVVATADSHALEPGAPPWDTFRAFYDLPEFTVAGLTQFLIEMAGRAGVPVDAAEAQAMVELSDKTLRTLCLNIQSAHDEHRPLSRATWLEAHGGRLSDKFRAARANYPAAPEVFAALHLLAQAAVPARRGYAHRLSSELAQQDTVESIDGLLSTGLLGERRGLLYPLNHVQIAESLQAIGRQAPALNKSWRRVIAAVQEGAVDEAERKRDLVTLARSLIAAEQYKLAEAVAGVAARTKPADANALLVRGLARARQGKDDAAIKDFTAAARSPAVAGEAYYNRGRVFSATEETVKAEADFSAAIAAGMSSADVYRERAWVRYQLEQFAEAEADVIASLKDGADGAVLNRVPVMTLMGLIQVAQNKYAEAEISLTEAILAGEMQHWAYGMRALVRLGRGAYDEAWADLESAEGKEQSPEFLAMLYMTAGATLLIQGNYAGAGIAFTAAIETGAADASAYGARAVARIHQGLLAEAEQDCTKMEELAPAGEDALAGRGLLHIARCEYDAAVTSYQAADAVATEPGFRDDLGLALLLAGRLQEALEVYRQPPPQVRAEVDYALAKLDFWTRQQSDRIAQLGAGTAVAEIETFLCEALERLRA